MADSPPQVSVLLPAFDAEQTIGPALRSIQAQTFDDWECIVADDGSTDATADIAEGFARRDPRFRVLRLPFLGLVPTLNAGLEACRGIHVARMDSDDLAKRERFERQVTALSDRPDIALVGCHPRVFPRPRLRRGLRNYETWLMSITRDDDVSREAFVECPLAHPTWMARTDVLRTYGYRDGEWAEDYDLLLRLIADGHRIGVVPEVLLLWRDGPNRLWRTDPRYALERMARCKAHFIARTLLADRRDYVLWGYGDTGRALSRALTDEGKRFSHVVEVHPGRIGQLIHRAPVVPVSELAALRGRPIVASVSGPGPRSEIRTTLAELGLVEGRHFVCAA